MATSSSSVGNVRALCPPLQCFDRREITSNFFFSFSPPDFTNFSVFVYCFSSVSKSANSNSVSMISASRTGSTDPSIWVILSSLKQRTTCIIAATCLICPKNRLPRPSPLLAPSTRPAISVNSTVAGETFCGLNIFLSFSRRWSGSFTIPIWGSIVQKG